HDMRPSPRYAWPLLVAGARACTAAAREGALAAKATALRDRLRATAGELSADGLAQPAHRLTFAAAAEQPRDGAASAEAGGAWGALGQPFPVAWALRRSAEAALSAGARDGGAPRLRRAAEMAQRLGARPLAGDIALLARRARIPLGPAGDGDTPAPEPERL